MTDAETRRRGDGRGRPDSGRVPASPSPRVPAPEGPATERLTATLRDARAADLEALYLIDQRCFEVGISYSRSELRRFLALPTAESIVLETEGRIIGFAIGHRPRRSVASVITLDVDSEHRRRGAGRRLLAALVSRWRRAGVSAVVLEVDVENRGAISFYERLGFRPVRRLRDYYRKGRDAFEMVIAGAEELERLGAALEG